MYCDKEEKIDDIYSELIYSICEAKEILNHAQVRAENYFIELPDMESIDSFQLDKETLKSFLYKLEDILTPSQLKGLEPVLVTFMEVLTYTSYKQGVRAGIDYKLKIHNEEVKQ